MREDSPTLPHSLDIAPDLLDGLRRVDRRNLRVRVAQRVGEPADAAPVSFQAGGHNEVVVGQVDAVGGADGVVGRVEGGDA